MRANFFITIIFFLNFLFSPQIGGEVFSSFWKVRKSPHFIIYYQEVPYGYISQLINSAEGYYHSIIERLGFVRFDFWTWENRAKIYLYPDKQEYQKMVKLFPQAEAVVHIKSRVIKTYVDEENFFDSILPHELGHIIFREFVGRNVKLPLWLDEGVACFQEESYLKKRLSLVKNMLKNNEFISLESLTFSQYNTFSARLFYAESAGVVYFLIEGSGRDKFLEFCRFIRDKKDWLKALKKVYGLENLKELEKRVREFFLNRP